MPNSIDAVASPSPIPKQFSLDFPNANAASSCAALPPDVVTLGGGNSANPIEQYTKSMSACAVGSSAPTSASTPVQQTDRGGHRSTADLSQVRATKIEVKFRTALAPVPNAQHAYIEITRANGSKQDLGAYPIGGAPWKEGGQLQFEAGNEKPHSVDGKPDTLHVANASFTLSVPPGESMTDYANALVDGAKHYNAHAVRYDGLGQQADRFNSNSFVSSLIIAKGGTTGLNDVRKIANDMGSGPVTVAGQQPAIDDTVMAQRVRVGFDDNHLVATGFGNARIERTRFERSSMAAATPPPWYKDNNGIRAAAPQFGQEVLHTVAKNVLELWQRVSGGGT